VQALEDIGERDNTLFIYIAGDNGTSAEGGFVGMYNEMTYFNQVVEKVEDLLPLIDEWGGHRPSRTWPLAGRWRLMRLSHGPSKWPRTSVVPATAW
jgi:arylsulfatase A-like enzyme